MINDLTEWRIQRLTNYRTKLKLSKKKAMAKLMLFHPEEMIREFDRIVDSKFWSSNEPGISHNEKLSRRFEMMKPYQKKKNLLSQQLKLF